MTSPASGAGSAPDPPGYAPTPQSAAGPQSVTERAASPAAAAGSDNRCLGLALLVIATAQLMVVLDATIVIAGQLAAAARQKGRPRRARRAPASRSGPGRYRESRSRGTAQAGLAGAVRP